MTHPPRESGSSKNLDALSEFEAWTTGQNAERRRHISAMRESIQAERRAAAQRQQRAAEMQDIYVENVRRAAQEKIAESRREDERLQAIHEQNIRSSSNNLSANSASSSAAGREPEDADAPRSSPQRRSQTPEQTVLNDVQASSRSRTEFADQGTLAKNKLDGFRDFISSIGLPNWRR